MPTPGVPYYGTIQSAAKKYGVPTGLLEGLFSYESGFNTYAVSSTGDYGLPQINLASHPGISVSQAESPSFSIPWAAKYLSGLIKKYGVTGGLEAYNAGNPRGITPQYPGGSTVYASRVLSAASKYGYAGGGGGTMAASMTPQKNTWSSVLTSMNSAESQGWSWFSPGADATALIFKIGFILLALSMMAFGLMAMLGIGISDVTRAVSKVV